MLDHKHTKGKKRKKMTHYYEYAFFVSFTEGLQWNILNIFININENNPTSPA